MPRTGVIYTETVVHLAPEAFAKDVPYEVAIVSLDGGGRITARIAGDRASIGNTVTEELGTDTGYPIFKKAGN